MDKISINDLPRIKKELVGYKLTFNSNGTVKFRKNDSEIVYELKDYINVSNKLYMPNYNNCILNVDASISKYYGVNPKYDTFSALDNILASNKYKHIAIMLLDGMGSYIIKNNLDEDSFLRTHKICDINAVFPPTTACAVPALCSGIEPLKTGWVGWSNYFTEVNKFVVMFRNVDYFSNEPVEINVAENVLPYKKFYQDFNTKVFELGPSFTPSNCQSFEEMCERYINEIKNKETSFCYMYWDDPDKVMHINGAFSKEAKTEIKQMDDILRTMEANLPDDTLVVITADHGHIDVNPIYLANFKDILSLLVRVPSNEGRCAFFKVKPFRKRKFVKLFNEYFADYFTLITKKDFIEEGYLGNNINEENYKIASFVGDYVAIAKKNYYFNFDPVLACEEFDKMVFKSHHAGITENEMIIPFVVMKK